MAPSLTSPQNATTVWCSYGTNKPVDDGWADGSIHLTDECRSGLLWCLKEEGLTSFQDRRDERKITRSQVSYSAAYLGDFDRHAAQQHTSHLLSAASLLQTSLLVTCHNIFICL